MAKKKRVGRPKLKAPHVCSVCGRTFTTGGRAAEPKLCGVHFWRARRQSPTANDPGPIARPPKGETISTYLSRELFDRLRAFVDETGRQRGEVMSSAIREYLDAREEVGHG